MGKKQPKRTAQLNGQGNTSAELRVNWSISSMPLRKKNKVVGMARMRDMTVSEFVGEIIDYYFKQYETPAASTKKRATPTQ